MFSREYIGAAIRDARKRRGWSQEALARRLRICTSYLIQVEKGKRLPSEELTQEMCSWMLSQADVDRVVSQLLATVPPIKKLRS